MAGPAARTLKRAATVVAAVLVASTAVWFLANRGDDPSWTRSAPVDEPLPERPRGGSVRVVVSTPPEIVDTGMGGDTLRQLVYPKLFVAQPDGTWRASLVEPGSDGAAADGSRAWFRLRPDAMWTNGTPITADDLRRSADARFVSAVEGPDESGLITVRLQSPLPEWRRLWSGVDSVTPPGPDVYGGPYFVSQVISGLETVVERNPAWHGRSGGPFLDEVRLVLAADSVLARDLLAGGRVDVGSPVADTVRTTTYETMPGVETSKAERGGSLVGLRFNGASMLVETRSEIMAAIPRDKFVRTLLNGEAVPVNSIADLDGTTWPAVPDPAADALTNDDITLAGPVEQPLLSLLTQTVRRAIEPGGARVTSRHGDTSDIDSRLRSRDYEVLVEVMREGPAFCWLCHFEDVDAGMARRADSGDRSAALELEEKLRAEALFVPLWLGRDLVAWRTEAVSGPEANGYEVAPAWNIDRWYRP